MSNFAVIQTGGKQYLVKQGDLLKVEKLEAKEGDVLTFDAMLVGDEEGKDIQVGQPIVKGANVAVRVMAHGRADKVRVTKYHSKTRYRRQNTHRQPFTELKVETVK